MNDYMKALHAWFCREPDRPELERALDDTYHALRENITRQDQELLLRAQDLAIDLREETIPGILHRRVSAGHGHRRRDRALLFRGRGGKVGHRKSQIAASPVQKLIRYTKKKGCQGGSSFLTF